MMQSCPSPRAVRRVAFPVDLHAVDGQVRANGRPVAHLVTAFGRTQRLSAWAAETGVSARLIYQRLASGHTPETAVTPKRPCRALRRQEGGGKRPGALGAASWTELEWDEDPHAKRLVAEFGALSSESLGKLLGMTRQRVQQIEMIVLRKLRIAIELVELLGVERAAELLDALRGKTLSEYEAKLWAVKARTREGT